MSHLILLKRLDRYGIRGCELMWFENYLAERKQRAYVGQKTSEWSAIRKDVSIFCLLGM